MRSRTLSSRNSLRQRSHSKFTIVSAAVEHSAELRAPSLPTPTHWLASYLSVASRFLFFTTCLAVEGVQRARGARRHTPYAEVGGGEAGGGVAAT